MDELQRNPTPDGVTPADHVWFLRIALTSVLVLCLVLVVREVGRETCGSSSWTLRAHSPPG